MKKGATPELRQKWWSKNKAMTLKKTGLGAALKDYEVAEDLMDYERMLDSLSAVKKKVATAFAACDRKRHAETLEALKKYPSIIQKKETEIKKKIKDEAARAANATAAPKQKVGTKVVIWQRDVAEEVKKKYNPPWMSKFSGYVVKLRLNDDILRVLKAEGDLATPQFMVEDAQDLCAATVEKIIKVGRNAERAAQGKDKTAAAKDYDLFERYVKAAVQSLGKDVAKVPALRWKKFVARKKQYKDYKIQAGCDVAIGTLQLAAGGVAIAGAVGTAGAALPLAIVGTVRGVAALAQTCHDLARGAEDVQDKLLNDLNSLRKSYLTVSDEAKKSMAVKEVTTSVLAGLLGAHPPFLASIPKCDKNFNLWSNKIAGLAVKGRDLSRDTMKLLGQVDDLEKQLKTANSKTASKTLDKVRKLRTNVSNTFDKAADVNARVKRADATLPKVETLLKLLKNKNSDFAKIFDRVFPAVVNLALAGSGAGVGFEGAKSALETANTAVGLSKDILAEVKTQLQAAA